MNLQFRQRFEFALDQPERTRPRRWVWLLLCLLAWVTFLPTPATVHAQSGLSQTAAAPMASVPMTTRAAAPGQTSSGQPAFGQTLFENEQRIGEQISDRLRSQLIPLLGEQNFHAQVNVTLGNGPQPAVVRVDTVIAVDRLYLERNGAPLRQTIKTLGQSVSGFDAERGDRFQIIDKPPIDPMVLVQRGPVGLIEVSIAGALALFIAYLALVHLRSSDARNSVSSHPEAGLVESSAALQGAGYPGLVADARAAVHHDPDAVVAVLRRWMSEDGR